MKYKCVICGCGSNKSMKCCGREISMVMKENKTKKELKKDNRAKKKN